MKEKKIFLKFMCAFALFTSTFTFYPTRTYAQEVQLSSIEISDYTQPTGQLEVGSYFILEGEIISLDKLSTVAVGVYYRNGEPTSQSVFLETDTYTFDIKSVDAQICFNNLNEGLYCYKVVATDCNGNRKVLVKSDFKIGDVSEDSEITAENTNFPSGRLKYGEDFKVTCDITSVQRLYTVNSKILKKDTEDVVCEFSKGLYDKEYTISEENENIFDFSSLEVGSYTYILWADDNTGYSVCISESDFDITDDSSGDSQIELTNSAVPSGSLKKGEFFNLRGDVVSKYNITKIHSAICLLNSGEVVQEITVTPNDTSYSLFPTIDYAMLFAVLEDGKYVYVLDAEDENGYQVNLVTSSFEIGQADYLAGDANLDGTVDIADVVTINAYIGDSEKNTLQPQGIENGDVQSTGNGINASDALTIQQYLAKVIDSL